MDLWGVYFGDVAMTYGSSVRRSNYRDFEQFPYGTLERNATICSKDPYSKVQEKCQQIKSEKALKKQCPFCKEQKKRPLINYIRKRESRVHHESICEGAEEEEEEEEKNEERVEKEEETSSVDVSKQHG